jgi:hypothetical protein
MERCINAAFSFEVTDTAASLPGRSGADDVRLGNRDWFVSGAVAGLYGRYVTGPYRLSELDGA